MLEDDERQKLEHIPVKGSSGFTPQARVDTEVSSRVFYRPVEKVAHVKCRLLCSVIRRQHEMTGGTTRYPFPSVYTDVPI